MALIPTNQQSLYILTTSQKNMLVELENVLDDLMYATNELQSNEVTSSVVYPTICYLKTQLVTNVDNFKYTKDLRKELVKRLSSRFGSLLYNEVFRLSTFLDPNFGPEAFSDDIRS